MRHGNISNRSSGAVVVRVEETLFTPKNLKYFKLKHLLSRFTPYSLETSDYLNLATLKLLGYIVQHTDYNCYLLVSDSYPFRKEFMMLYKEFLEDIVHVQVHVFEDKKSVYTNDLDDLLQATGAVLYVDEDVQRRTMLNNVMSSDVDSAYKLVGVRRR